MKKALISIAAAAALAMGGVLAGCGSNAPDTGSATATQAEAENASVAEPAEGYELVFVCPIIQNEYWEDCIRGIEKADEELGTHTTVVGPQTADNFAVEIIDHMKAAIESKPAAIMGYLGVPDLHPLVDEAVEAGIPVLAIDSDAPDTKRTAYVGTNLYNFGFAAGEELTKLTGGSATIGYICSSESAEGEQQVFKAFQDAIHDYDMEVVATAEGNADPETAHQVTLAMLEEHPEITAIFCSGGYNATGAAMAKKELGRNLILVGFDDVQENLDFVREGVIDTLLVQSPYQMGYQGVRLMKECLDNGSLSNDTYDTGSIVVTQANVDTYKE